MSTRPSGRGIGIAALGVGALLAAYGFGTEALVPLGVGLLALPLLALALVAVATAGLDPTRVAPRTSLRAGDLARFESGTIGRRRRSRLASLLSVRIDPRLEGLGTVVERGPDATVVRLARGLHDLPGPRLEALDPLGLAGRVKVGGGAERILVAPRVIRLSPDGAAACGLAGAPRPALGAGTDLDRIREYRAGDPLSSVHWAQTAKRGALQTKVLTGEGTGRRTVALTLDATEPPAGEQWVFEEAVTVATSLAHALLREGVALRLEIQAADGDEAVATSSRAVVDRVLAVVRPAPRAEPVGATGRRPRRAIGRLVVTTRAPVGADRRERGDGTTIVVGSAPGGHERRRIIRVERVEELAALLERREGRVSAA